MNRILVVPQEGSAAEFQLPDAALFQRTEDRRLQSLCEAVRCAFSECNLFLVVVARNGDRLETVRLGEMLFKQLNPVLVAVPRMRDESGNWDLNRVEVVCSQIPDDCSVGAWLSRPSREQAA